MKLSVLTLVAAGVLAGGCGDDDEKPLLDGGSNLDAAVPGGDAAMGFFVSSSTSTNANLGGLSAADTRCQTLATAVGAGNRTWRAFLSVEHDSSRDGGATSAFDRIGRGPWRNAKGALLASDLGSLRARYGDPEVFLDERGNKINGQWGGSPTPNEHDVLTGTLPDGGVALGRTCEDWVSASDAGVAVVGHTDGLGPMQNPAPPYNSWFSVHDNGSCADTAPRGGAGRIYCFASD